ncbi:MAG: aryl-sulfate sulfotransferase [Saprospiraceae bacterium]
MSKKILGWVFTALLCTMTWQVQTQTVGLFEYTSSAEEGYVLFAPFFGKNVYLVDNCGRKVHEWQSDFFPAAYGELLENGNLLRTASEGIPSNPAFVFGGAGQHIQEVDWDGNIVWQFTYSDSTHRMHHDFVRMPNGHILIPAWEIKTQEEAIQAGRNPDLLPDGLMWAEFLIEVEPTTGEIVWEWHVWDHLIQDFDPTKDNYGVVAEHPELLDINLTGGQTPNGERNWLQVSAIDYNPMMDQIIVSSFFMSEFYIIDHSTSTQQAAGHTGGNSSMGGDLLYRWGNPQNYDHGTADDRRIFGAHNVHWIPAGLPDEGKIMFFNNGTARPDGNYSSVDVIIPPVDSYLTGRYIYEPGQPYGPSVAEWSYSQGVAGSFYSPIVSGAQRLPNGNTLICSGFQGWLLEVTPQQEIVWSYISPAINTGVVTQGEAVPIFGGNPSNLMFRALRYTPDFAGFAGADLTPGNPVEAGFPEPYVCEIFSSVDAVWQREAQLYPNPTGSQLLIRLPDGGDALVHIWNAAGQWVGTHPIVAGQLTLDVQRLPNGVYALAGDGIYARFVVQR